jgi:hypothetical protein
LHLGLPKSIPYPKPKHALIDISRGADAEVITINTDELLRSLML